MLLYYSIKKIVINKYFLLKQKIYFYNNFQHKLYIWFVTS